MLLKRSNEESSVTERASEGENGKTMQIYLCNISYIDI